MQAFIPRARRTSLGGLHGCRPRSLKGFVPWKDFSQKLGRHCSQSLEGVGVVPEFRKTSSQKLQKHRRLCLRNIKVFVLDAYKILSKTCVRFCPNSLQGLVSEAWRTSFEFGRFGVYNSSFQELVKFYLISLEDRTPAAWETLSKTWKVSSWKLDRLHPRGFQDFV